MMNIAVFCVNYNSYKELTDYLLSWEVAFRQVDDIELSIKIADNTDDKAFIQPIASEIYSFDVETYLFYQNMGYFGAIQKMMNECDMTLYDYVIISNVDLKVTPSFLCDMLSVPFNNKIGWIASQIYSVAEKRDRNPKIQQRYKKFKLLTIRLMYRWHRIYRLYTISFYRRKKLIYDSVKPERRDIYAGHGSFIILTQSFFEKVKKIDYPVFLFGEEIYLAELCRKVRLQVLYEPDIKVEDIDHVSTRHLNLKLKCKCNYEALTYLLHTFYE